MLRICTSTDVEAFSEIIFDGKLPTYYEVIFCPTTSNIACIAPVFFPSLNLSYRVYCTSKRRGIKAKLDAVNVATQMALRGSESSFWGMLVLIRVRKLAVFSAFASAIKICVSVEITGRSILKPQKNSINSSFPGNERASRKHRCSRSSFIKTS